METEGTLSSAWDLWVAYQLAFRMPGIRPALAKSRRQMRQMPNLR